YTLRTAVEIDRSERALQAERSRKRAAEGGDHREPPPIEVSRALASGADYAELPLQAIAFVFGPRPEGRVRSLVSLEVDLGRIANLGGEAHPATVLSLSIAGTHPDSGEIPRLGRQGKAGAGAPRPAAGPPPQHRRAPPRQRRIPPHRPAGQGRGGPGRSGVRRWVD